MKKFYTSVIVINNPILLRPAWETPRLHPLDEMTTRGGIGGTGKGDGC